MGYQRLPRPDLAETGGKRFPKVDVSARALTTHLHGTVHSNVCATFVPVHVLRCPVLCHQAKPILVLNPNHRRWRLWSTLANQIRSALVGLIAGQRGQHVAVIVAVLPPGGRVCC